MTQHLYIHIPFCKEICTYCDFYRIKTNDYQTIEEYINKIVEELKNDYNTYKTVYIGGGTPNLLSDKLLDFFLSHIKNKLQKNYEFSIECNPEFISQSQINVLLKNKINRISIGVQTTNNTILKLLNRRHNLEIVQTAIELVKKNGIENISCDFIYNLPLLKNDDLDQTFKLIKNYQIPHVSFYSLELKKGSILTKQNYHINPDIEEEQLKIISQKFFELGYMRYEVSNWATNQKYCSQHNLAYWNLSDWKGIGISSYGFENNQYYWYEGSILEWVKKSELWTQKVLDENIFIMGLRKTAGIDLTILKNKQAFENLKSKLNYQLIEIVDNKIRAKNIDLLNEILVDII